MFTKEEMEKAIDTIRPFLQADGGDIKLNSVSDDGKVFVSLQGACGSCPMATFTLKMGVEERLRELFPDLVEVIAE